MDKNTPFYMAFWAGLQQEKGLALYQRQTGHPSDAEAYQALCTANDELLARPHEGDVIADPLPGGFTARMLKRRQEPFELASAEAVADWYGYHLERPAAQLLIQKILEGNDLTPTQANALTHLTAACEQLGQMRDMGLCVYGRGEIRQPDIQQLKGLAEAFLTRERLFLNMADEGLRQKIMEVKARHPDGQNRMEDMLRKLKSGYAKGLLADTPMPVWFQTMQGHLIYMHEALDCTLAYIANENRDETKGSEKTVGLEGDIEWQLASLATYPLFRGLPEKTLRAVLRGARIIDLEKNNTFITQGEPLTRLYVIMDGWVKTLKASDEGEESILQIAGKREALLDNGALSTTVSSFSAKTVAKTKLLSLLLANLREHALRQPELAQNLLTLTTARLQKLVAQYEQITLRTASQRVGWFLVNLYLETGLEGAPLELPFEKALIASYLNIKPETFSRVLQQFRKDGFKIEKDRVVMPHPQALCSFCDPDLALRCCRAEAVDCAPIRIAKRADTK